MSAENFLSMFKVDAVEYSMDLKKYCPDINEIGLNNNLNNKTSSDKKYPNLISKYNKNRLIGKSKLYNDKNLDYQDKLNNHCNTNFASSVSYEQFS